MNDLSEKDITRFIWDSLMHFKAHRKNLDFVLKDYQYISPKEVYNKPKLIIKYNVGSNYRTDTYQLIDGHARYVSRK